MSTASLQAVPRRTTTVEFQVRPGDPDPQQLIYALAGVTRALDVAGMSRDDGDDDFNMHGNLAVAAHVLARQLADRIA